MSGPVTRRTMRRGGEGFTTTISVNGGPEITVPPGGMERLAATMKLGAAVGAAKKGRDPAPAGQTDIEDDALGGRNPDNAVRAGGIAADRLRSIVDRIERLEEERKALSGDIKDIYAEAKSAGFDVKVLRQLIRIRKQEPAEVEEQETLLDVYRRALGM